uniref:Uncharacterized protein n=1 Tax=Rhizophora mucronata TaxID=61149 RepID=A0A2P2MZS7_RHIMU
MFTGIRLLILSCRTFLLEFGDICFYHAIVQGHGSVGPHNCSM